MVRSGMVSVLRIRVLLWADILAEYVLWVMMTYLIDVWQLSVTHAAGILNIFWGSSAILPLVLAYLVDTLMGDFSMLLLSSLAYCVGLGFLSMSTAPVMGICSEYVPECIGNTQKTLFYTALVLLAVGIAGYKVSLERFIETQCKKDGEDVQMEDIFQGLGIFVVVFPIIGGINLPSIRPWSLRAGIPAKYTMKYIFSVHLFLFAIIGCIVLPSIRPWSLQFGIPAICTVVATLMFLSGSCSYQHKPPQGSPITTHIRVFFASASKLFHRIPADPKNLYESSNLDHQVPHSACLSCLDKAAVILPNQPLEQQEKNRWRLCRVTEVEETKTIIRMIPMWATFIMCGVVSSIGDTYFLEQANNMNPKVGKLKVPLTMLLLFNAGAKAGAKAVGRLRKCIAPVGIALAMILSVLCCITAAKVENKRLNVIIELDLLDEPDERIPMTMFWLVPQFLLLGALDGFFESSVDSFFESQAPRSMGGYLNHFTGGVKGLGRMGSVLTVYVSGMISERGGKLNWFQKTLNRSRMDNYYWTLAALSAANLILYIVVALFYSCRESEEEEDEEEEENQESAEPFEDNAQCCCCCCCCWVKWAWPSINCRGCMFR